MPQARAWLKSAACRRSERIAEGRGSGGKLLDSAPVRQQGAGGRRIGRGAGGSVGLVLLLLAGPALAKEPQGSAISDPQAAVTGLAEPCRTQVAAELRVGQLTASGCEVERRLAQRRQLRSSGSRASFGLVESRRIELARIALVVSEARGCRQWPLRGMDRAVLGLSDVRAAGCWIRRFSGELELVGVTADGRRLPRIHVLDVDAEGRVEVDLGRLALSLGRRGVVDLDGLARLELGADGWAGSVDLVAVRAQLADWHAAAVQRGRGVPALMIVRHPEHVSAARIRGVALADSVHRQEADYHAVQRGELAPYRFLERHAWSPYRHLVAALVGGH